MSHIKREIERGEKQWSVAAEILVEADVLRTCPMHEGVLYHSGGDIVDAYRFGNARFRDQQINYDYAMECFGSPREMTDTIKEVYEDCFIRECQICAKD